MADTTNDAAPADETAAANASVSVPMALDPWNASSNITLKDYSIAADDQHIADAITSMDPIYDVRGPISAEGDIKVPSQLSVNILPPELAEPIHAQLKAASPMERDALEQRLVIAALEENSLSVRLNAGIAGSNDPYWHEKYAVAREELSLTNEAQNLINDLSAVVRVETIFDDNGVKVGERPVPKLSPAEHDRAVRRLREVDLALKALEVGGPRRIAKALHESVEARKAAAEQQAMLAEAKALAKQMARTEHVEKMATAFAKSARSNLG